MSNVYNQSNMSVVSPRTELREDLLRFVYSPLNELREQLLMFITFWAEQRSEFRSEEMRSGRVVADNLAGDVEKMRYKLLCTTEKFFRYAYNLDEVKMLEYHNKAMELETKDMEHVQESCQDIMFKHVCESHMESFNNRKDVMADLDAIRQTLASLRAESRSINNNPAIIQNAR